MVTIFSCPRCNLMSWWMELHRSSLLDKDWYLECQCGEGWLATDPGDTVMVIRVTDHRLLTSGDRRLMW